MSHACSLCLVILSSLWTPSACSAPERDLSQWLKDLSLRLPSASVTKNVRPFGVINLTVSELTCTGFSVGNLAVAQRALSPTTRSLDVTLEAAAADSCSGHWAIGKSSDSIENFDTSVTRRLIGNASGSIDLVAAPLQDMAGSFSFSISGLSISLPLFFDGSTGVEDAFSMQRCKTTLRVEDLRFHGRMRLLKDIFSHFLQWLINSHVDHFGCRLPARGLVALNDLIRPFLHQPTAPHPMPAALPLNASSARLVNWSSDVALLADVPDAMKGAVMLRSVVEHLSNGTDQLGYQIPDGFSSPLIDHDWSTNLGLRITANLTSFSVSGLGTVTECQALEAAADDPHSLRASCAFDSLNVSISFTLELTPVNDMETVICQAQAPFLGHISLNTSLQFVSLDFQALLAADYDRLQRITLDGLLLSTLSSQEIALRAAGTMAAALYEVNITELEMRVPNIESVVLTQDGGQLGLLLAASADNFLQAFLGVPRFQNVLPNVLDSEVFPEIRQSLNRHMLQALAWLRPHADPSGGATKPHATKGIDPDHISLVGAIAFGAFLPAGLIIYFITMYKMKRSRLHEATFSRWNAMPDGSISGCRANRSLSDACSGLMQFLIPMCLMSNMAIALFSILVPLCDVRMRMRGGLLDPEQLMADDSLLVYSFFEMVRDFWHSGAKLTASLLVSGGLVLPFACGLISLVAFGFPMPSKLREWWCTAHLIVIRMLFVNQAFISLVIVQLRMELEIPGANVTLIAEPIDGLVTATAGTLLALAIAALLLHLHHAAEVKPRCDSPASARVAEPDELSSIGSSGDSIASMRSSSTLISRKISLPAILCALAACACLIGAWTTELISFTTSGLAGVAANSQFSVLQNPRSVFLGRLPADLYSMTDVHGSAVLIGGLLFLVTILGPAACCLLWLVQWTFAFISKTSPRRTRIRLVRFAANASPYLVCLYCTDVMWVAVGAAWLEMDLSVQFIVMNKVGDICSRLQEDIHQPCIHLTGEFHMGCWWLLASVLLSFTLFVLTMRTFGVRAL